MCLLIWTVFSGERCGPWASCLFWLWIVAAHHSFVCRCLSYCGEPFELCIGIWKKISICFIRTFMISFPQNTVHDDIKLLTPLTWVFSHNEYTELCLSLWYKLFSDCFCEKLKNESALITWGGGDLSLSQCFENWNSYKEIFVEWLEQIHHVRFYSWISLNCRIVVVDELKYL